MVRVLRCPYCVLFDDFMVMNPTGDGLYVCSKCGHTLIPDSEGYECSCRHCEEMKTFERFKSWQLAGR
jgi:DNA-directed RNA polymerase subunit RPC12/RpoP